MNGSLPNLSALSAQIDAQNERVSAFVDTTPGYLDHILGAVGANDWPEVARASEFLSQISLLEGQQQVAETAQDLKAAVERGDDVIDIQHRALRLIGASGLAANAKTRRK